MDPSDPAHLSPDPGVHVPPAPGGRRRLLRRAGIDLSPLRTSRDFRLNFVGSMTSMFGSMVTFVAIPYQVAHLTGSPLAVGLLGVCELVPILIMAFVGGALADYVDRRRLVLLSEVALAVVTGGLLLNATMARPAVWVLFVCSGLFAGLDGIQRPALDAMIPRLVTAGELPAASALGSLRMNVAAVAGPAVGGLLIAAVDLPWVYAVDVVTFAFSLVALTLMRAVPPPPGADRPSLRSVMEGLRYARSRPELLGTYLVDINAMFFGTPMALIPFVADRMGGPAVLGMLYAAPSAGAILATLTSGWSSHVHRHGLMVVLAAGAWGAAIVGFGFARSLWLAVLFLALAGAADMISGMFRGIIWNQTIPDHLRGRLAGIEMVSYTTGPLLGNTEAGLAASVFSIRTSIVSGGILCVAGTGLLALLLPAFLRYDGRRALEAKQAADAARGAGAA
ncbi:MAG: MFS transporter [Actinomycetota bacterium]|nr:MFS transporter [Actinomycetota bacterium]